MMCSPEVSPNSSITAWLAAGCLLLLSACGDPGPVSGSEESLAQEPAPEVLSAREALQRPNIPEIDLGTMQEAEIEKVLPQGAGCRFAYTLASPPVMAATVSAEGGAVAGVIKIHGRLVELTLAQGEDYQSLVSGPALTAEDVRLTISPDQSQETSTPGDAGEREADLVFELQQELVVGYRGWYTCSDSAGR